METMKHKQLSQNIASLFILLQHFAFKCRFISYIFKHLRFDLGEQRPHGHE